MIAPAAAAAAASPPEREKRRAKISKPGQTSKAATVAAGFRVKISVSPPAPNQARAARRSGRPRLLSISSKPNPAMRPIASAVRSRALFSSSRPWARPSRQAIPRKIPASGTAASSVRSGVSDHAALPAARTRKAARAAPRRLGIGRNSRRVETWAASATIATTANRGASPLGANTAKGNANPAAATRGRLGCKTITLGRLAPGTARRRILNNPSP